MNKNQAAGKWKQLKGRVEKAWGELTDDDTRKAEGTRDKLHGAIRESIGNAEEKTETEIEEFHNGHVRATQEALTAARTLAAAAREAAKTARTDRKAARQKFAEDRKATRAALKKDENDVPAEAKTIDVEANSGKPVSPARPRRNTKKTT